MQRGEERPVDEDQAHAEPNADAIAVCHGVERRLELSEALMRPTRRSRLSSRTLTAANSR
jgi:hypothetical protein